VFVWAFGTGGSVHGGNCVLLRVGSEMGGDFSGDIACDDGDAGSSALGRPEGSSRRRHALQV